MSKKSYGFFVYSSLLWDLWMLLITINKCFRGYSRLSTVVYRSIHWKYFHFPHSQLNEWNERMDQWIILVAGLWVIEVTDLGGLINEFDPRDDWHDQVSGCLVLIIYVCPIIHTEMYSASSSKFRFINIKQQTWVFPGQLSQNITSLGNGKPKVIVF